jgi:uncharacterized protein YecE (DUF72 family)
MRNLSKKFFIGTSGWVYEHWKGPFYPEEINNKKMLPYYSKNFKTVEVNNTFYKLPKKAVVENWSDRTPSDFVFALKANRYITHMKNLKDGKDPIHNFIKIVRNMGKKLGPILFQLPPPWNLNFKRIKQFTEILPGEFLYVFELRNSSWYVDKIYNLFEENNIALCFHDITGKDSPQIITANFLYIRFHGPQGNYQNKYTEQHLTEWAKKIILWLEKDLTIYIYFNNDAYGRAIENAKELRAIIANQLEKKK